MLLSPEIWGVVFPIEKQMINDFYQFNFVSLFIPWQRRSSFNLVWRILLSMLPSLSSRIWTWLPGSEWLDGIGCGTEPLCPSPGKRVPCSLPHQRPCGVPHWNIVLLCLHSAPASISSKKTLNQAVIAVVNLSPTLNCQLYYLPT